MAAKRKPRSSSPRRPSPAELYAMGRKLRDKCSRAAHAVWKPPAGRPDPIRLLKESSKGRIPELIPLRYGRMLQSPFTFYRGAALNMAVDLAKTPHTGLRLQACGDCHLLNFGAFATPERRVILDINDFDETFPAPWEWDLKRLATSFVLASRNNKFTPGDARDAALACVRSYRESMAEFSEMSFLDVWYQSLDVEKLLPTIKDKESKQRLQKRLTKARQQTTLEHHFPGMVVFRGKAPTIKDEPPLIFHFKDQNLDDIRAVFSAYRESLPEHKRILLDRYRLVDIAVKVVGVGSVG